MNLQKQAIFRKEIFFAEKGEIPVLYHPEKELTAERFRDPGKEYRAAPFWAWNCKLDREEMLRQIGELKEMGFGGFHMHPRKGLETVYLGEDFLNVANACVEKAREVGMLAYLYDEDRWPSGFAGGYVTSGHPEFRARSLVFAPERSAEGVPVGRFEVRLREDGTLDSYRRLSNGDVVDPADEWFADLVVNKPSPRYNNATYVDTLNPEAIRCFIRTTHEVYRARLGKSFGKDIPTIFSDEPQFSMKKTRLSRSTDRQAVILTWTDDLPESYAAAFGGEDLVAHLPELIWNLPDDRPSVVRWHYHDHVCERFVNAYMDQIGAWCRENGIGLTGHMMEEDTLTSQTCAVGEAMRSYRGMTIPGIDMLCGAHHFGTAKQCQSAVRQYGREGMMSELYGVMGWDLDFRRHKHHGDWQAALGVTLRVPHLSLASMVGDSKHDYPQSIHYQSPWYRQYPLVENHFARLNTVLTRGKATVRVAVIHPIESLWLHFGANDRNDLAAKEIETNFKNVTEWLLLGGIDFDYVSEALLPSLNEGGGNPLRVGQCAYEAVIVPACETLRSTTLERLSAFREAGGKLIFLGAPPACINAVPDARGAELWAKSESIAFSRAALLKAVEPFRDVEFRNADGSLTGNLIYQMREEDACRWLFVAHGILSAKQDFPSVQNARILVRGHWRAELYDTLNGSIRPAGTAFVGDRTELTAALWEHDSLLFRLIPAASPVEVPDDPPAKKSIVLSIPAKVPFRITDPNVCMLDLAEYSFDGGAWQPEEEILRIDTACRTALNWPIKGRGESQAQPWVLPEEPPCHTVAFRFTVQSEIGLNELLLAVERPEVVTIRWNGEAVPAEPTGYYVDRGIRTIPLPGLRKGKNTLLLEMPFDQRTTPEWVYLLGNFGVRVEGRCKTLTAPPETLVFTDIFRQGLAFWSGALTYEIPLDLPHSGEIKLHVPQFRAAVLEASVDGGERRLLAFSPYTVSLGTFPAGKHRLSLTAYVNRSNTFGALHNTEPAENPDGTCIWYGPAIWRTDGDRWSYEYNLFPEGLLRSPTVTLE